MRTTGTVKWFNDEKGYGFIKPDSLSGDVFVHRKGIAGSGEGRKTLVDGQRVEFDVVPATGPKRGPTAENVSIVAG